jgi:hypothetical protein
MGSGLVIESVFQLKSIRSMVGSEDELVADLKEKNPKAFYFKMLGNFDILEIMRIESLHEAIRVHSDGRILNINSFPCFCPKQFEGELLEALKNSISPSLILLKLQDYIFLNRGLKGLLQVSRQLCSCVENVNPFALIGMGYYEIMLWVRANDFNSTFSYIKEIRRLKISDVLPKFSSEHKDKSLLLDSIALPCISYENVIQPKNWKILKGNISPILKVKCAPGHEDEIANQIPATCHYMLGADDLLCIWPKPIKLNKFIDIILNFRKKIPEHTVTDTITKLFDGSKIPSKGDKSLIPPTIDPPVSRIFEQLEVLGQTQGINKFIIGEIINIVSLINTHIGNRTLGRSFYELIFSILQYLNGLLNSYKKFADLGEKDHASIIEAVLLSYATCIRASISQQFSSKGYSEFYDVGSHPTFACSLARITKAISLIPEQLFRIISTSSSPAKLQKRIKDGTADDDMIFSHTDYSLPWVGFLFLDLKEGYRINQQGELIAVPYRDIFSFLNWITLSHEVSHGYYVRIDFEELESDYLKNVLPSIQEELPDEGIDYYDTWRKDTIFELFAHWFDYKHFFNSELDFYLWSIWRTYIDIPRVHRHKLDYWARSLFVRLCHFWKMIEPKLLKIYESSANKTKEVRNIKGLFLKELDVLYGFIEEKLSGSFDVIKLSGAERVEAVNMVVEYYALCPLFENDYVNKDIIDKANLNYPRLDKDIKSIQNGKVITTHIKNPFLLLREILKTYYDKNILDDPRDQISLALIFSFWEASRRYKRKEKIS